MTQSPVKATVIVRAIRGGSGHTTLYVRIPRQVAETLDIHAGDPLLMEAREDGTIVLKKLKPA